MSQPDLLTPTRFAPSHKPGSRTEHDAYWTPGAVAEQLVPLLPDIEVEEAMEPHVGGGAWVGPLRARWPRAQIIGADIDPRAPGLAMVDRPLVGDFREIKGVLPDVIAGNPPYATAIEQTREALRIAPVVGFLLRAAILESARRRSFWAEWPPAAVHVLTRRPSFTGGTTDACMYAFIVWDCRHAGPPTLGWV